MQVVCSIHQPNSHIMECFDDLLLLSNGHTAYYGPWHKSVDYFQSQGFICPVYTNPSDYYLTITKEAGPKLTQAWSKTAKAFLPEVLPGGFSGSGGLRRTPYFPVSSCKSDPQDRC
jgi:ABC-type multidrug transport system ATPase subunit